MYDLYDHITAELFEPGPILITNFLCQVTNLERQTPSQYNGWYLCIPSMGSLRSQKRGWGRSVLSKKRITACHAQRGSSAIYCALFSYCQMQETALLSTAIPHRPSLGLVVASAVVGHTANVPLPK